MAHVWSIIKRCHIRRLKIRRVAHNEALHIVQWRSRIFIADCAVIGFTHDLLLQPRPKVLEAAKVKVQITKILACKNCCKCLGDIQVNLIYMAMAVDIFYH